MSVVGGGGVSYVGNGVDASEVYTTGRCSQVGDGVGGGGGGSLVLGTESVTSSTASGTGSALVYLFVG